MRKLESFCIVRTRVQVSNPSGIRLRRGRLLQRIILDDAVRVVAVEAPGGYGKTSLIYDALQDMGVQPAWYNVHDDERDPLAFLAYIVEAVHVACPELGGVARTAAANGQVPPTTIVALLLNEILELSTPVHLVIDDVHRAVSVEGVREILDALIESAPHNLRLYLLSREPLTIHMSRLRSQRRAVLLRADDLAFTAEEIGTLFQDVWGCPLEDGAVQKLCTKSGGWITALVLVHLAMERLLPSAICDFVDKLHESSDVIFSYLTEEILTTQPPHIQNFLRETSILQQFDAEAAQWVTSASNASNIIADIDRRRLFLVPVDGQQKTFRYHHLFESFLRETLARDVGPEGWRRRQQRASDYYLDKDPCLAIGHAIEAQMWTRAAELIGKHGTFFMQRGWTERIATWLAALPDSAVQQHPKLLLLRGALEDLRGDWVTALRTYELALEHFHANEDRAGLSEAMERSALCLGKYGDWQRMKSFLAQAHGYCPADDSALRARILAWEGANLSILGEAWDDAYRTMRESYLLAHRCAEPEAVAAACFSYGFVSHLARGSFDAGIRVMQEGIELFNELQNAFVAIHMMMNQVVLLYFAGRLTEAEARTRAALELAPGLDGSFAKLAQESNLAKIKLERLDLDGCEMHLRNLEQQEIPWQLRPWCSRTRLLLHARRGGKALAEAAEREMFDALDHQGMEGLYAPECLIAACAANLWLGQNEKAREYGQKALNIARTASMSFWQMKALAWLSWVGTLDGVDDAEILPLLEEALRLTREGGYDAFWVNDFGGFTVALLIRALAAEREVEVGRRILQQLGDRGREGLLAVLDSNRPEPEKATACGMLGDGADARVVASLKQARRRGTETVQAAAVRALRSLPMVQRRIEIRTLGAFSVELDGSPIKAPHGKTRALTLLKLLLSRPNLSMLLEEVADVMWPDVPPRRARQNVRVQVCNLRDLLCPARRHGDEGPIVGEKDLYRLECGKHISVDCVRFEELMQQADLHRRDGRDDLARETYLQAQALYAGDYLPDDIYESWSEARRSRLRDLWTSCLLRIGDLLVCEGQHDVAVTWYQRVLEADTSNEGVFQKVLHCFVRLGDRASAVRQYEQFRANLHNDLALEPTAQTRELVESFIS